MKKVVVIGGGFAGLAAAKAASSHFDQVIIYNQGEAKQSLHQHVLLKSGQIILENLFPGIGQKFIHKGCLELDWAKDTFWENADGVFPNYNSSIKTLSMSRTLLQQTMKEELTGHPNIQFINEKVTTLENISASLVIIAGGQNFPLKRFLGDVYSKEMFQTINLTYRSYLFNYADLNMKNFKQYYYQIDPPRSFIGGVICPVENALAMVTLIEKEEKISKCETLEDFVDKAKQIPGGNFYEIIKDAVPLNSVAIFRKVQTHRKILNEKKIPEGIIVLGDTLNSLNPIFGQGMTLSLMQVELLEKMFLSKKIDERYFHNQCNKLSVVPSLLSKIGSEEKGFAKKVLRFYLQICQRSKALHQHFLKVLHSLAHPGKWI